MIIPLFVFDRELGEGCEARNSSLCYARAELVMWFWKQILEFIVTWFRFGKAVVSIVGMERSGRTRTGDEGSDTWKSQCIALGLHPRWKGLFIWTAMNTIQFNLKQQESNSVDAAALYFWTRTSTRSIPENLLHHFFFLCQPFQYVLKYLGAF